MKETISMYQKTLTRCIEQLDADKILKFMDLLRETRDAQKKILIMGNGGSGASASHFAGDMNKGLSLGRPLDLRYRVISLADNAPTVMSLANDVSYDDVFVEQMKNFLSEGDLVIGLSGSGNSENVIRAVEFAKSQGAAVVGLTAFSGGRLKGLSDLNIHIDTNNMQIAEDMHMILLHMVFYALNAEDRKNRGEE